MMILLALFSFATSYWVFYKLTSKVDTKDITKSSSSVIVKETPNPNESDKTIVIGDGQGSPTPDPNVVITPNNNLAPDITSSASTVPTPTVSLIPSATPSATITPTPTPTPMPTRTPVATPSPLKTIAAIASVAKIKQVFFKVRVGSFDSRADADKKLKDLENMGYDGTIIEESEGNYVQLGSFKDQDKALGLAEEVSQKGFSVIIRQLEE